MRRASLQQLIRADAPSATGFRKILKKWDKRSKSATKELYLSRQVEVQPCFNREFITELSDAATANVAKLESLADTQTPLTDASDPTADRVPSSEGQQQKINCESMDPTASHKSQLQHERPPPPHQQQQQHEYPSRIEEGLTSQQGLEDLELALKTAIKNEDQSSVASLLSTIPKHPAAYARQPDLASSVQRILWNCLSESSSQAQSLIPVDILDFTYSDDISGRTCLHSAAQHGRADLIRLALAHAAPIDAIDAYGRQALHYAAMYGHAEITQLLLSAAAAQGASAQSAARVNDVDGRNPVVHAVANGHVATLQVFIQSGVDLTSHKNKAPEEPMPLSLACQNGHEAVVQLLLANGAPIVADIAGYYPQHLAAREGHAGCLKLLATYLEQHPKSTTSMDEPDKYSVWTPLFHAASEGHYACVQVLLAAGASVEALDEAQNTAVHYAAWRGHIDCLNLLLSARSKARNSQQAPDVDMGPGNAPRSSISPEDVALQEELGDDVPDLALPPPIIPFRVYGHNYLDDKILVQLTLSHPNTSRSKVVPSPIKLYNQERVQLKLVISARSRSEKVHSTMPHNVLLPLQDERETFAFQMDTANEFSLDFDVYPTFGSRLLGKATALPSLFSDMRSLSPFTLPILDHTLKPIGELDFEMSLVKPFDRAALAPGGHLQTYWKSSTPAPSSQSQQVPVVTGSSLSGEHIRVIVQVTRDGHPVAYPFWRVPLPQPGNIEMHVEDLTLDQFMALAEVQSKTLSLDNSEQSGNDARHWHSKISGSMAKLSDVLQVRDKIRH